MPREDVEMMREEDEESFKEQAHEDSGHAFYRSWCPAGVEGREAGG